VLERLSIGSNPSIILSILNRNNNPVNPGIFSVPNNPTSNNDNNNTNQKINVEEDKKIINFENSTEEINLNNQNELFNLKYYDFLNESYLDFLQSLFNLIPFLYSFLTLIFSLIIIYYPLKETLKLINFYYKYK
jgi:hypothetical protein